MEGFARSDACCALFVQSAVAFTDLAALFVLPADCFESVLLQTLQSVWLLQLNSAILYAHSIYLYCFYYFLSGISK